jgi:hypothetical protein
VHRIGEVWLGGAEFVNLQIGRDEIPHRERHLLANDVFQFEPLRLKIVAHHQKIYRVVVRLSHERLVIFVPSAFSRNEPARMRGFVSISCAAGPVFLVAEEVR